MIELNKKFKEIGFLISIILAYFFSKSSLVQAKPKQIDSFFGLS